MFGKVYEPGITPNELVAGSRAKPFNMPSRDELIKRDSFCTSERLKNNRYLDKLIGKAGQQSK